MIKWGLYGVGTIADKFAHDFRAVEEGHIIAAYGRRPEAVSVFCEKHDILKPFTDEIAFLSDPSIDVIYVATPHIMHAEVAIKALEAGKHVLCEKPFTMNASQTDRVLKVANEKRKYIMEALWTLFLPSVQNAIEWIESGRIGRVMLIEGSFGFHGPQEPKGRLLNPDLGGGALLDVGIYPMMMANRIAGGTPTKLNASCRFTETGVDETTLFSGEYENGILFHLKASIQFEFENTLTVYGDKGKIVIPSFWMAQEAFLISSDGEIHDHHPERQYYGYQYEARAVCKDI